MSHDNEYDDNMVTMLELIWGEGYMAPLIERAIEGMDRDRRIF